MKSYKRFIVEDLESSTDSEVANYRLLKAKEDFEEESEKPEVPGIPDEDDLSPEIEKAMDSEIEPGDESGTSEEDTPEEDTNDDD